jgi:hypothetical protein
MLPILSFGFGCAVTGAMVAVGAYHVGVKGTDVLVAIGIFAGGLQALFFLVWYLVHRAKTDEAPRPDETAT